MGKILLLNRPCKLTLKRIAIWAKKLRFKRRCRVDFSWPYSIRFGVNFDDRFSLKVWRTLSVGDISVTKIGKYEFNGIAITWREENSQIRAGTMPTFYSNRQT